MEEEIPSPVDFQDAVLATEPVGDPAMVMNREAVAKGFAWTASLSLVAKVLFPVIGIFISRSLGPTILGIAATLQMTLQLSEVIRDAGLGQSFLSETEIDERVKSAYSGLAIITGLLPAVALLFLTPTLAAFFNQKELLWSIPVLSACLVMNAVATVPTAMIMRRAKFKELGMVGLTAGGVALLTTVALVWLKFGFAALVVQFALGSALNLALTLRLEPLSPVRFEGQHLWRTFSRSRALLGANIFNNLFLLCDVFVIQKLLGPAAAGLYNTAQNIAYKPLDLVVFPLSKTLVVAFGGSANDLQRLSNGFWRAITAIVMLVIPVYVLVGLNADAVVRILYGKPFAGAIPVLTVLSIYLGFRTIGNVSGTALVPAGRHAWTLYPWFAAIAVTAGGITLCMPHPTLMNIVWSFTAGAIIVYTTIFFLAIFVLRPSAENGKRFGMCLAASCTTAAFLAAIQFLVPSMFERLAICLLISPVVHLATLGLVLAHDVRTYVSYRGLRRLWHTL